MGLCIVPGVAIADDAVDEGSSVNSSTDGKVGTGESGDDLTDNGLLVSDDEATHEADLQGSDELGGGETAKTGADATDSEEPAVEGGQVASADDEAGDEAGSVEEPKPAAVTPAPAVVDDGGEAQVVSQPKPAVEKQPAASKVKKTGSDVRPQTSETSNATVKVKFRVHIQDKGNSNWKSAGIGNKNRYWFAGTTGKSLRLEALYMKLDSSLEGSIQYQVHVQNVGWQTVRADGKIAGTKGKSYRLEGVRIALIGEVSKYYDIYYQTHVENEGWQAWKKNGTFSGTSGKGYRLEGLRVYLAKKTKNVGVEQTGIVNVVYRGYVQSIGNQAYQISGGTAGTNGKNLRLEKLTVRLNAGKYANSGISMSAHIQDTGWKKNVTNGKIGSKGLRLEAFKMKLTGPIKDAYDIKYRAHVQNVGWQPWVLNNGTAGTTGRSLRIEALQIKLVKKGASARVSDGTYVITLASNAGSEYKVSGSTVKKGGYSTKNAAGKFYVRNENGGVTLQSVSTGKFVAGAADGAVSLAKWNAKSSNQVWKLSWNGGYRLTNKATSKVLGVSGGTAITDANGKANMFTKANLVNDGDYILTNVAKGTVLNVSGASFDSGANIGVYKANNGGGQVFTFKSKGNGWYTVTNAMSGKAVDVAGGATANGTNVRQYNANGAAAQQWGAHLDRGGNLYFINRASGNALTANGSGNVVSSKYKGSGAQKWTMKAGSWSFTGNAVVDEFILRIAAQNDYSLYKCFNWMGNLRHVQEVDGRTQWGIMSDSVLNSYAIHAAEDGVADCYVDAATFCWLARACGYDANMRAGGCPSRGGGTVPHGWTEIYEGGTTYVCDPNLNRDLPSYNWYMISYSSSPVTYSL